MTISLASSTGPRRFAIWQDGFPNPTIFFHSSGDSVSIASGSHTHFSWGFSPAVSLAIPGRHYTRFSPAIPLEACPDCGVDLRDQPVTAEEKRQVFDLPPIKLQVTEYQAACKFCPNCRSRVTAQFPENITAPAQYGPAIQATMAYLNVRQIIPCARTAEICQDLFHHRPSNGSVVQAVAKCAAQLTPAVDEIRAALIQAPVLHADETEVRCEGKTRWLHVVSNATHTLFSYSPKRGEEGIKVRQVLTEFSGNLIHDFWGAYDTFACTHSRCNAHLLRELTACVEDGHLWAENCITTLLATKQAADQARANSEKFIDPAHRACLQKPYDDWVAIGLKAHPKQRKPPYKQGRPGRVKQSTETN